MPTGQTKGKEKPKAKARAKQPVKIGRPTKYNQSIVDKAQHYLDEGYAEDGSVIPSTVGLALYLDITRTTVDAWGREEGKEPFSYILDKIQAKQCSLLLNKGLTGDFTSPIAKLVLGKHGYHERHENENTHRFGDLSEEELNARIRQLTGG